MRILSGFSGLDFIGWLADFYLLATLLMLVALVARRWMRQPAKRLTVDWIVGVELAVLALVCAMPFWPRLSLRGPTSQQAVVETPLADANDSIMPPPGAFPRLPPPRLAFDALPRLDAPEAAAPPVSPKPHWPWIELTAAVYLTAAGLAVMWLGWGALAAMRACRRAEPAPQSLQEELARIVGEGCRVPRLLVSSRVTTAVALGLRRPTILLPAGLVRDGSPQTLRAVLTHEWAHIRHGDLWLLALGRCLLVLLFAHPLFWWLRRAIRGDQELLADAAAAGDDRPAYAEELLRLVRKTAYPSSLAASVAVGIWESPSQLSRRIAMLLDESFRIEPTASRRWRYQVMGLLLLFGAACSLVTLQPRHSAGEQRSAAPAAETTVGERQSADSKAELAAALKAGEAFLETGDFDKASAAFTKAIKLDPHDGRAYYSRACAYKRKGDAEKAGADCTQGLRLDPKSGRAYFTRGWAYGRSRKLDAAIRNLTENSQRYPDGAGTCNARGCWYLLKGEADKAIADCTKVIELMPGSFPAYANRGFAFVEKGDLDKAIADSSEAIRLNPSSADAYGNRAYAYAEKGDLDKAIADSAEAIRLAPQSAEAYYYRGYAYQKKGDRDSAKAAYASAVRLDAGQSHEAELRTLDAYAGSRRDSIVDEMIAYEMVGYWELRNAEFRKELRLTAEQEKKLREISADYRAQQAKTAGEFVERVEKIPQDRRNAEMEKMSKDYWETLGKMVRKQVEETLTPQQLDAYKNRRFASMVFLVLTNPDGYTAVGFTRQQREEVRQLRDEWDRRTKEESQRQIEELLSMLAPAQREKLRAEVERRYREAHEPPEATAAETGSVAGSAGGVQYVTTNLYATTTMSNPVDAVEGADRALTFLPVYEWLGQTSVRKQLGISAAQEKQLAEISGEFQTEHEKLMQTAQMIATEEQEKKRLESERADGMLKKSVRQRIETLLTPPQLAALKDTIFHAMAFPILMDPRTGEKIGLSQREQAKVQSLLRAAPASRSRSTRLAYEKLLALLTPQQQEKLRKELGRQVWSR